MEVIIWLCVLATLCVIVRAYESRSSSLVIDFTHESNSVSPYHPRSGKPVDESQFRFQLTAEICHSFILQHILNNLSCFLPHMMDGTRALIATFTEPEKTMIKHSGTVDCADNIDQRNLVGGPGKGKPTVGSFIGNNELIACKRLKHFAQKMMGNPQGVGDFSEENRLVV